MGVFYGSRILTCSGVRLKKALIKRRELNHGLGVALGDFKNVEAGRLQEGRAPHCSMCGYPLVGVSREGECPECGESAASALSVGAFFERDQERLKWTRLGLRVLLIGFLGELICGLGYLGLILAINAGSRWLGTMGWVAIDLVHALNATLLVLMPLMCLAATYALFYGITRVNKTGRAVAARSVLIVIFVLFLVSLGCAWMILALPGWRLLAALCYWMSLLVRLPAVLPLAFALGLGLLVAVLSSAVGRLEIAIPKWSKGCAYGAVLVLLTLTLGAQGFGAYVASRPHTWMVYQHHRLVMVNPPWLAPAWSVLGPLSPGMPSSLPEMLRRDTLVQINTSDSGSMGVLRWSNVLAWWGAKLWLSSTYGVTSVRVDGLEDMEHTLGYGVPKSSVSENYYGYQLAGGEYVLWPELLWGILGWMTSMYLWGYVVVLSLRLWRKLPKRI